MPASIRSLARSLDLSATTVSHALNGRGRTSPETVQRVLAAAAAADYRPNPLAGSLMSELRRARGNTFRGVLAAVDIHEPDRPPHGAFHHELLRGAKARALKLGFKVELFMVGRGSLTMKRLDSILKSRGIHGIILLPAWYSPNYEALDWARYAGVYTDYNIQQPPLHCVCCDHYRSMIEILERLVARGYRRPGLYFEKNRDERLQYRWSAAFLAFQHHRPEVELVAPQTVTDFRRETFVSWFRKYKPDVVIGHLTDPLDWMESCGARVPETHGYVCLNVLLKKRPAAGLDRQPEEVGARAVELVIAQLHRNELGIPQSRTTMTVSTMWCEGPSLRPPPVFAEYPSLARSP